MLVEDHPKIGAVDDDLSVARTLMKDSSAQFGALLDAIATPVAVFSVTGELLERNGWLAELLRDLDTEASILLAHMARLAGAATRAARRQTVGSGRPGEAPPARGEVRLLTRGGREYWIESVATFVVMRDEPRVLVTAFDTSERLRVEAALQESQQALRGSEERSRELAGTLMLTQEQESRRISRELHDDVNQIVASMAIDTARLADVAADLRGELGALHERMQELSEAVRRLSHQLHPATLEHMGLASAVKSHCLEFSQREGITVSLNIQEGIDSVPQEIALCLYRVTQEALRNIARHAHTLEARLTLAADADGVSLAIVDGGVGFDVESVRQSGGLGLVSMDERIRLLHGILHVKSQPGRGTELLAHLPFP
jgi:signal transduction histidine kinase